MLRSACQNNGNEYSSVQISALGPTLLSIYTLGLMFNSSLV